MKRNETALKLPFSGEWFVNWGGDSKDNNKYHHEVSNQKYAYDFIVLDENNVSHKGDDSQNDNYYAFSKEILAPADGVIIKVIDDIDDNRPGETNEKDIAGNAVLIQHKEDEISLLAHLKKDSIKVKVGDSVKTGQVIGLCGNSGNSTEPHLHYHLQDSEDIYSGEEIKCFFQNVYVKNTNKQENEYSPVMDDIISQN